MSGKRFCEELSKLKMCDILRLTSAVPRPDCIPKALSISISVLATSSTLARVEGGDVEAIRYKI
jgi:hypothetical protein